jgi:hypothetical protein
MVACNLLCFLSPSVKQITSLLPLILKWHPKLKVLHKPNQGFKFFIILFEKRFIKINMFSKNYRHFPAPRGYCLKGVNILNDELIKDNKINLK